MSYRHNGGNQVTSRGCSKAYMICLFYRALEHAIDCHENNTQFFWPYSHRVIVDWIRLARVDMMALPEWDG